MRLPIFAVLLLVAASVSECLAQRPFAFVNVTIVDVEKGGHRFNQTVVIDGSRIIAAGNRANVRIPRAARVIAGNGKFLIPGLWDMHVHEFPSPYVPGLFLANGVTGIRDMYDDPGKMRELCTAIREHRQAGPRVVRSGPTLNGGLEKNAQTVVWTAEQGRAAVREQLAAGVDFIKVYNGLAREPYFAIADECRKRGVPFVGHTPDSVTTVEAAAAGQRSIEHLDGVLLDSSSKHDWLRRERRFIPDWFVLSSFDTSRAKQLFAAYVKSGAWHCPTISIYRADVLLADPSARKVDPNMQAMPKIWAPKPTPSNPAQAALARAVQKKVMDVTAMMYQAGVHLLAGTDTGYPYVLPGYGLHDELELMVAAGLPVAAVLRIATLAPAQFLGREGELGSIAPGRLADLVLLDADPLESIANTRRVQAVVADGQLYDRATLDRLLPDHIPSSSR